MKKTTHPRQVADSPADDRPFGTETPRPRWPLALWSILFGLFAVFLIAMAWLRMSGEYAR